MRLLRDGDRRRTADLSVRVMVMCIYTEHTTDWQGVALLVRWCPQWLGENAEHQIAHLEIIAKNKSPLPITETGYKSHFIDRDAVESLGGPVAYALAWLDGAAQSPDWKAKQEALRQLSLF